MTFFKAKSFPMYYWAFSNSIQGRKKCFKVNSFLIFYMLINNLYFSQNSLARILESSDSNNYKRSSLFYIRMTISMIISFFIGLSYYLGLIGLLFLDFFIGLSFIYYLFFMRLSFFLEYIFNISCGSFYDSFLDE